MTENVQEKEVIQNAKPDDKEINFRKQQAMYERMLEAERSEKIELQKQLNERAQQRSLLDDDDSDDDPYVDHKKLEKKLSKFEQMLEKKFEQKAEQKARMLLDEERKNQWLKNNPDFYEVMGYAQKFAERDPDLAETILEMPEGFERQKLVYKNIKSLGLHKKEEPKPSIQETIDKNRRSPYYQPSGVGSAPYSTIGDFSPSGQKTSYQKMKELQNRLRG